MEIFSALSSQLKRRYSENVERFRKMGSRRKVISYTRKFLDDDDFQEIYTPSWNMIVGAADILPSVISPRQLWLTESVIVGLNRAYEIGMDSMKEVDDVTQIFTCEFYMAYNDYYDLMQLTEKMLSGMVKEFTKGSYKIKYHADGVDKDPIEIDFTPPFRKIDMIAGLEEIAGLNIPKDLSSDEANQYLKDACLKHDIKCPPPETTTRLLDKLVGHFVKETCVNPTFIINPPEIMSCPLAKGHRSKQGLSEQFELFVNKRELCNAYTVLDDPVKQRQRFADQLKDRQSGDVDKAMVLGEMLCTALEYGLPRTAGWSLAIDRLAMLLTDSQNIEEILLPAILPRK